MMKNSKMVDTQAVIICHVVVGCALSDFESNTMYGPNMLGWQETMHPAGKAC